MRTLGLLLAIGIAGCHGNAVRPEPPGAAAGVEVTSWPTNVTPFGMVWSGSTFAVVFAGRSPAEPGVIKLYVSRVTPAGEVSTVARFAGTISFLDRPRQLFAVDDSLILWMTHRGDDEVFTMRLDASGDLVDGPDQLFEAELARVARHGTDFGVLYVTGNPDQVYYRAYDDNLESIGSAVQLEPETEPQHNPFLTWVEADGEYVVGWDRSDNVHAARIDPSAPAPVTSEVPHWVSWHQYDGAAIADASGRVLYRWLDNNHVSLAFWLTSGADAVWETSNHILPSNRHDSIDVTWLASGETIWIAWQSDSETATPGIYSGRLELGSGAMRLAGVRRHTSRRYYFGNPMLAEGGGVIALAYLGSVEGTHRVYVEILEP